MATDTAPPPTKGDGEAAAGGKKKGGKKKLLIILVVLLLVAGAGFKFLMPGDKKKKEEKPPPPPPGPVLKLDTITVNLADGHFLKLGLALEMAPAEGGGHGGDTGPDGSAALDIAIDVFSNKHIAELNSEKGRHEAKEHLTEEVKHAYHGHVAKVYFTEFVMQ